MTLEQTHYWLKAPGYQPPDYLKKWHPEPTATNALDGNLYRSKCGQDVPKRLLREDFCTEQNHCEACDDILFKEMYNEAEA